MLFPLTTSVKETHSMKRLHVVQHHYFSAHTEEGVIIFNKKTTLPLYSLICHTHKFKHQSKKLKTGFTH